MIVSRLTTGRPSSTHHPPSSFSTLTDIDTTDRDSERVRGSAHKSSVKEGVASYYFTHVVYYLSYLILIVFCLYL
jgi:hypothetical protein